MLPDDSIDDMAISNNGDMIKILATVVQIAREFLLAKEANTKIVFKGNTDQRTVLYQRILKRHFVEFSSEFVISAFVRTGIKHEQILFNNVDNIEYFAFFIKLKS